MGNVSVIRRSSSNACATGEALDEIVMDALGMNTTAGGEDGGSPGLLTQLSRTVGSMQRFMKQLSN